MESLTVVEEGLQKFVSDTVTVIERFLHDGPFNICQPHFVLRRRFNDKDNVIVLCNPDGITWKVFHAPEFCDVSPDMVFHLLCVQLYKAGYKERPQSACVKDGYHALVFDCPYGDPDTPAMLSSTYNKMISYMIGNSTDWSKVYTVYLRQHNEEPMFYMFCRRPLTGPGAERTWVVKPDNSVLVDTFAVQMVMLMLNKGYQVRRLYTAPVGLETDMKQCRRLLEFTAVDVSSVTGNNN